MDGEGAKLSDSTQFNVTILAVDGQRYFDGRYLQNLKPGFHYLQLASNKQGRRGEVTYQPFAFVAQACKRYTVYARHKQSFKIDDWQVILKNVVTIKSWSGFEQKAEANTWKKNSLYAKISGQSNTSGQRTGYSSLASS